MEMTSARRTGALQLAARFPWLLFRRLAVIACEDVGLGDPHALPVVLAARTAYEQAKKQSRNPRPDAVLVVWPALYLARAAKNREADDLANAVKHLIARGWTAPIPSYAIDLHTEEGRDTIPADERLLHWLTEASHVEHDAGPQDGSGPRAGVWCAVSPRDSSSPSGCGTESGATWRVGESL
jgi:MgsA AAA+ ATPase C terminal